MTILRKSVQRHTFQKEKYLEREAEKGKTPQNNEEVAKMVEYYDSFQMRDEKNEKNPDWKINNLEYDLRTNDYIAEKCKQENYAQNLYAALCNNDFIKNDVWPILQGTTWSCSWRYAGGIIADIRQEGDYINWYCSGIRGSGDMGGPSSDSKDAYVSEGYVTDEIRNDLLKLGWIVATEDN